MKRAVNKWVFVLSLLIVLSGILQTPSLKLETQPLETSEENRALSEEAFSQIEEEKPGDYFLTAENDTHYRNLSLVNNWQFDVYYDIFDMAVVGNLTYLATGRGLIIYNMSNPANPDLISQSYSGEYFQRIQVEDDLVYLEQSVGYYLTVINCSDLINPLIVNRIRIRYIEDFVVENGIVYVTMSYEYYGLKILNFSDPYNPYVISEHQFSQYEDLHRIVKHGDYLICLSNEEFFYVFDISNILDPLLITTEELIVYANEIIIEGNTLYLLSYLSFEIWDITNIYNPNLQDVEYSFGFEAFTIHNNLAYILDDGSPKLLIYNVTNPNNIQLLATDDSVIPQNYFHHSVIHVEGSIATITCGDDGFTVLNISDPLNIQQLFIEFAGQISGIHLVDDYAIIKYKYQGFKIFNVSNILNPICVAYIFIGGLTSMFFEGNLIYCYTIDNSEFLVVNITDIKSPVIISRLDVSYSIDKIIVRNGLAFLVRYSKYLIVNVTDPTNTSKLFDSSYYYYLDDVAVFNEFLIVAYGHYSNGYFLDFLNITNPTSPELTTRVNLTDDASKLVVNGTLLYVYNAYPYEIYLYDIKNVTNPLLLSHIVFDTNIYHFTVDNDFVYYLTREETFEICELNATYNLTLYGKLTIPIYNYYDMINIAVTKDDLICIPFTSSILVVGFDEDNDLVADFLELNVYGTDPFDSDSDDDSIIDGYEIEFNLDPLNGTDADLDYDGDNLTNYNESLIWTNPWLNDTDFDLLRDDLELLYGTDPLNPDTDSDGLMDFEEIFGYSTNPNDYDSDDDDISDGAEVLSYLTDPLDNDTDDDFMPDGFEILFYLDPLFDDADLDLDLDGLTNLEEYLLGTYPLRSDTDSDGYTDFEELEAGTDPLDRYDYPDYPSRPNPTEPVSWSGYFITTVLVFSLFVFWMRKRYPSVKEVKRQ